MSNYETPVLVDAWIEMGLSAERIFAEAFLKMYPSAVLFWRNHARHTYIPIVSLEDIERIRLQGNVRMVYDSAPDFFCSDPMLCFEIKGRGDVQKREVIFLEEGCLGCATSDYVIVVVDLSIQGIVGCIWRNELIKVIKTGAVKLVDPVAEPTKTTGKRQLNVPRSLLKPLPAVIGKGGLDSYV